MSVRDRGGRAAQMRAERVRWRGRSRSMSQASRNMSARLRRMNVQASALDMRLHRHAENSASWHAKWDDPQGLTNPIQPPLPTRQRRSRGLGSPAASQVPRG
jgi:hypothetical protein